MTLVFYIDPLTHRPFEPSNKGRVMVRLRVRLRVPGFGKTCLKKSLLTSFLVEKMSLAPFLVEKSKSMPLF